MVVCAELLDILHARHPSVAARLSSVAWRAFEYRGYDSQVALTSNNGLYVRRAVGKLVNLVEEVDADAPADAMAGIGIPVKPPRARRSRTPIPLRRARRALRLVHNGIIENADALRAALIADGEFFSSEHRHRGG